MSIRTCVARALCAVLTAAVAVTSRPARAEAGLLLGRLSKGDVRVWRAIEEVVAASNASGEPRSPTLRRLWDWAQGSAHVLHVEMVSPSRVAFGVVGLFHVERVDPAGQSHAGVIRLCPRNIRCAKASRGPNAVEFFVRFEGLTDVERYAEVLAHELAHAEYFLESPERLEELQAAQGEIGAFLSGSGRPTEPVHHQLGRRLRKPLAVLAASEAHAEAVEAVVLRELAADRPSRAAMGRVR